MRFVSVLDLIGASDWQSLIHTQRADSRMLAALVAKEVLEVVLQETLVRLFSSQQFERCCNLTNCCTLQIAPFL